MKDPAQPRNRRGLAPNRLDVWTAFLLATLVAVSIPSDERTRTTALPEGPRTPFFNPSSPIAGIVVTPSAQAGAYQAPIPALPSVRLEDGACSAAGERLTLLASWVSLPDAAGHSEQIAMNYSGGIWMAVSPMSFFAEPIRRSSELPGVEEFFTEEQVPLETGEVRGHAAWIKERSPELDCSVFNRVVDSAAEVNRAVMFPPSLTADVSWKEHGAVVELAGPYPVAILESIAEGMTWSDALPELG